jgi:hypothetical protein
MLKIATPNSEIARINNLWTDIDGSRVYGCALSEDFESEIAIERRYPGKYKKQYSIHLFFNANINDNNIFDIRDIELDDRIALLAPITAFSSVEHTRAEDDYFTIVASQVFWELLLVPAEMTIAPLLGGRDAFEISDFYDDGVAVLIVPLAKSATFDVRKYIPTLFSYGYTPYRTNSLKNSSWKFKDLPKGKEIKIQPVKGDHLSDGYLETLYRDLLPSELNPLAGFLLQYQVLEMLMQYVFDQRLAKLKTDVNGFAGTASDLRDLFKPLQDATSERERIKVVVENANIHQDLLKDISSLCETLLKSSPKVPKSGQFSDLLYDVRNLIFHNYRAIPVTSRSIVEAINKELMWVLPHILSNR